MCPSEVVMYDIPTRAESHINFRTQCVIMTLGVREGGGWEEAIIDF